LSGGGSPSSGHYVRGGLPRFVRHVSTFLRPFAPDPLRPFSATLDALTPAGLLGTRQVSLIPALGLPTIPSPTTYGRSASPRHVPCRRVGSRPHPHGETPIGNPRLRHSLAGSPRRAGRIEFVILRTGRSPPAALHPVSRRRSCSQLQVTLTWRGLSPLRPSALSGALERTNVRRTHAFDYFVIGLHFTSLPTTPACS